MVGRLAVLCERCGLSMDLRDEDEVRTTAGEDGAAAADMTEVALELSPTDARRKEQMRALGGATHWA